MLASYRNRMDDPTTLKNLTSTGSVLRYLIAFSFVLSCVVAQSQEFTLGEAHVLPEPKTKLPIYHYTPDGHCTAFKQNDSLVMFWPGENSFRTTGHSIFEMSGCVKVLPRGGTNECDNGGAWLYSIFQKESGHLLGFYHAEDHRFPASPESRGIAYKSIAMCESNDGGLTWKKGERILTAYKPKPDKATWSGLGDHCAVWDEKEHRYLCFFQEEGILCMAESMDAVGKAGSWKKWFEGSFREPGLGGRASPIPAFASHHGGNPSVHWNTFLNSWVIVWHTWTGSLWISTSTDLITWTPPKLLLKPSSQDQRVWYPTIIGESDLLAGEKGLLLYARFPDKTSPLREFEVREITFKKRSP